MTNSAVMSDAAWVKKHVPRYGRARKHFKMFAHTLGEVLQAATRKLAPLAIVQARPKSVPSFAEKILRKRVLYADPLLDMTDLCGGRVITHTAGQVQAVCQFIEEHFLIDWANSADVSQRLGPAEFGYRSVHYIVSFKPGVFPTKDVPVKIPQRLLDGLPQKLFNRPAPPQRPFKAEIQVRTILEHAWADIGHDMTYKTGLTVPEKYKREFAAIAAILESADREFGQIHHSLQGYQSNYGRYLKRDQVRAEIDTLELVLECEPENLELAAQIATLAMTIGDWHKVIQTLSGYESHCDHLPALRALGIARIRQFAGDPSGADFQAGRRLLETITQPPHRDAEALCALADSWVNEDEEQARQLNRQAFEIDPADPTCLTRYLQFEIQAQYSSGTRGLLAPIITAACQRCRNQIEAGVNLPWAYLHLGGFRLLLGQPYEALADLAKAVTLSPGPFLLEAAQESLRRIRRIGDKLPGYSWAERFILLAQAVQDWNLGPDDGSLTAGERETIARQAQAARQRLPRLASAGARPLAEPVVIVAGGCDESVQDKMETYRGLLYDGFELFQGTLISGGTQSGIAGLVGDLRAHAGERIRTVGYVPANPPANVTVDRDGNRYDEIRTSPGSGFTPLEPLQNWIDLVAAGVRPRHVRLVGINGGTIAAAEYRIAAALGGNVVLLEESGREADKLFNDRDWSDTPNILRGPPDAMTLRAFLSQGSYTVADGLAKQLAPEIHAAYQRDRQKQLTPADQALADWKDLPEPLRISNIAQAQHIFEKLRTIGCRVAPAGKGPVPEFHFTPEEVELLARIEHGRWNVERLQAGWHWGKTKDLQRKLSPYLVAWDRLPGEAKQWDRDAVNQIPALLAAVHLKICRQRPPAPPPTAGDTRP